MSGSTILALPLLATLGAALLAAVPVGLMSERVPRQLPGYATLVQFSLVMLAVVAAVVSSAEMAVSTAVDLASAASLSKAGAFAVKQFGGLDGIVFSPFLHGSFAHLYSNAVPLIITTAAATPTAIAHVLPTKRNLFIMCVPQTRAISRNCCHPYSTAYAQFSYGVVAIGHAHLSHL
jgi:hypothetical protein